MNCAEVKDRLIDFLYDEMPPEARASLAEHLRGCPTCRKEVASLERTLGSARTALGGSLWQEPPARVHLAVMAAAKAAVEEPAVVKPELTAPREEPGFFARLWRTPWFLPAFGAASVAVAVFLVRVLENPEVLPGQHPHSIEERALAPEPAPTPEPAIVPTAGEAKVTGSASGAMRKGAGRISARALAPMAPGEPKRKPVNRPLAGRNQAESPAGGGGPSRFAVPPPPLPAPPARSRPVDELQGALKNEESVHRRIPPSAAPAGAKAARAGGDENRLSGVMGAPAKREAWPAPATEMAKPASHMRSEGAPAGAAVPSYAPAAEPTRDHAAPSAASAPAFAAPPPAPRSAEEKQTTKEGAGAAESDFDAMAKDKEARAGRAEGPSAEQSERRADRLFASQDWSAAGEAYRDLLRRFPGHKHAPKWRARMNESLVAEEQRQARTKKAKGSSDAVEGPKR
jgi:hypothetical protein